MKAFISGCDCLKKSLGRFCVITRLPATLKTFYRHEDPQKGVLASSISLYCDEIRVVNSIHRSLLQR